MAVKMPQSEANIYCFRVGVTGHRRLDDPAAVVALVKRAIDAEAGKLFPAKLRKNIEDSRLSGTAPISYCVVSPLAEGADRPDPCSLKLDQP